MKFYFRHRQQMMISFISLLSLFTFNANASECGVFQLQSNRSSAVSVTSNKCDELPYISKGAVFDLAAQGRLWLKSTGGNGERAFQMICQNRTRQIIQLEFSDPHSPWLNVAKLNNCSGWVDNKLSCAGNNGEKLGVYCVSAFLKPVSGNKTAYIQRTASVKMRNLDMLVRTAASNTSFDKQQILADLQPELKLCKQVSEVSQDVQINWVVQMTQVKMFQVMSPEIKNDDLSACVEAVITTTSYPMFSRTESFESTF